MIWEGKPTYFSKKKQLDFTWTQPLKVVVLCLFPCLVVVEVQVVVQSHKTLVFKPDPFKGSQVHRPKIHGSPNKSLENYMFMGKYWWSGEGYQLSVSLMDCETMKLLKSRCSLAPHPPLVNQNVVTILMLILSSKFSRKHISKITDLQLLIWWLTV